MCASKSCCCGSAPTSPGGALGLAAAVIAAAAIASAAAAILADVIDALAVATACAVIGTAAFCAWRVRVLTRPAPDPAPGAPARRGPARALPAPDRLAIEPPRPPAAQPGPVYGTGSAHPAPGKAGR